jgi:DNA invertase Pin-like site-specific DNA recombinase
VDRFARSVRGLASLLEAFDAAGVAFCSATEPFDTATPARRMMVQMLGVFAEFERATIIDRVIAGLDLAQQILRLRSEDYAHRASNASDYLLAGLITCTRCGKG